MALPDIADAGHEVWGSEYWSGALARMLRSGGTADAVAAPLTDDEIADVFDPEYHVRNVDRIFRRVGLEE